MLRAEDGVRDEFALVFCTEQLVAIGIVGGCDIEIRPIRHELAQRRQEGLLRWVYLRVIGFGGDPLAPKIAIERDVVERRHIGEVLIDGCKAVGGRELLPEVLQKTQGIFSFGFPSSW